MAHNEKTQLQGSVKIIIFHCKFKLYREYSGLLEVREIIYMEWKDFVYYLTVSIKCDFDIKRKTTNSYLHTASV